MEMTEIIKEHEGDTWHGGWEYGKKEDLNYIKVELSMFGSVYFISCKALGIDGETLCEGTRNQQEVANFVFHRIRKEFYKSQTILQEVWPHCYPGQNTPLVL